MTAATSASTMLADTLSILLDTMHEARLGFDYALIPLRALAADLAPLSSEALGAWYLRGVALALAVGCAGLAREIGGIASTKGVWPVKARFDRLRADFPTMARFFYFPSWLHLCHADWILPSMLAAGAAIGCALVWSSLASRTGLFVMWSIYLSYASVLNLNTVSDNLLLEMGFLSLFFPSLDSGSWNLVQAPLPLLTFSVQCLMARRLWGSATSRVSGEAFTGAKLSELSLSPCIPAPLTRASWLLHQLPHSAQLACSLCVVLLELLGALLCFVPGWPRMLGLLIVLILQLGAALTSVGSGALGLLLPCVLSVSLLDAKASLLADFRLASLDPSISLANAAVQVVLALVLVLHAARLSCFDACWAAGADGSPSRFAGILRLLAPWRLSHSPAQLSCALPPAFAASARYMWIPVIESSADQIIDASRSGDLAFVAAEQAAGKVLASEARWERYVYKALPSCESSVPAFSALSFSAAPSRIEQAILSESLGIGLMQTRRSPLDATDPYSASGPLPSTHTIELVCASLLRGESRAEDLFGSRSPRQTQAQAVRVSMFLLEPTSVHQQRRTGRWFLQHWSHALLPVITAQDVQRGRTGCLRLREPELFEADEEAAVWAQRSRAVQQLLAKLRASPAKELSSMLVAHGAQELTAIKSAERARIGSSSVAPILRAHAAAMESSSAAAAPFAFQSAVLCEDDVQSFWIDFVKPLQPLLKTLHCPPPDLDHIAAPLHPLQNGSRHAGLSDTVLQRARNHAFKTDHPWNLSDPQQFTNALRQTQASALWSRMAQPKRELHAMVLARLTMLLMEQLRPLWHGPAADESAHSVWSDHEGLTPPCPRLDCSVASHLHLPSLHHLAGLCHHIIGHGCAAYERVLRDPSQSLGMLDCYSTESSVFFTALFDAQRMAQWARHRRMLSCVVHPAHMRLGGSLAGSLSVYYSFLGTQFKSTGARGDEESFPEMAPLDAPPRFFARQWKLDATEMPTHAPGKRSDIGSSSGSAVSAAAESELETIAALGRTSSRVSTSSKKRQ